MRKFLKNRPRLLVICKDKEVSHDLVMLLTGFGYYVDYVETRKDGLNKFRHYKHSVVFLDTAALPKYPKRMLSLFKYYKRNPIVLIVANKHEENRVYRFIEYGMYDLVELPLRAEVLAFRLRHLLLYNTLLGRNEYLQTILIMTRLAIPLLILLVVLIARAVGFKFIW
jgi:DNA-binding response OmpR family regulator